MPSDDIMNLVGFVFCILCGLLTLVIGIQLCRGKWYRIIAGNSDADEKTIEEQKKQSLGLGVGVAMFVATGMIALTAVFMFLKIGT